MSVSKVGLVLAIVYVAVAVFVLASERTTASGGWIALPGMGTFLVTLPVSAPAEMLGFRPNFRKNIDMALTIGLCALMVYFVGAGIGWLFRAALPKE